MFRGSDTNSFRYFLARFKSFARPQLWLAGLSLVGILAFAWEFSQRPAWQQALSGRPEETISPEDKESQALGAEIDSLPLLSADFNLKKHTKPTSTATDLANLKLPQSPISSANSESPLPGELDSLAKLFGAGLANGNASSGGLATLTALSSPLSNPLLGNSSSSANPSPLSTASNSPIGNSRNQLSEALNRYSPATPNPNAPMSVQPSEQPSPANLTTPGLAQYAPTQGNAPVNVPTYNNLPPLAGSTNVTPGGINSYTGLTSGSVPDVLSPGEVGVGVAAPIPVSTSPTLVSPGSTPLPPGTSIIAPPPSGVSSPVSVQDLPFTAPRSIPGRSIGGGEIGTFSNP